MSVWPCGCVAVLYFYMYEVITITINITSMVLCQSIHCEHLCQRWTYPTNAW